MIQQIHLKNILILASLNFLLACVGVQTQPRLEKSSVDADQRADTDKSSPVKKRVIILPFKDDTNKINPDEILRAEDAFKKALLQTSQVTVVSTLDLSSEGPANLQEELRKHSVQALLKGELEDLKLQRGGDQIGIFRQVKTIFIAKVRMRVVHARTKRELMNTLKTVTVDDSNFRIGEKEHENESFRKNPEVLRKVVSQAFNEFVPQVVDALSGTFWEGRIAQINNDKYYLNVGKISGVQIDDLLRVVDEGDEIYDKGSGRFIGKAPGRMKGTLRITGFFGEDGSIAVMDSGAGFKENDRVELYQ